MKLTGVSWHFKSNPPTKSYQVRYNFHDEVWNIIATKQRTVIHVEKYHGDANFSVARRVLYEYLKKNETSIPNYTWECPMS